VVNFIVIFSSIVQFGSGGEVHRPTILGLGSGLGLGLRLGLRLGLWLVSWMVNFSTSTVQFCNRMGSGSGKGETCPQFRISMRFRAGP